MALLITSLRLFILLLHPLTTACWMLDSSYGNGVDQFTYNKLGAGEEIFPNIT